MIEPSSSACPLCGSAARRLLLRKDGYDIVQCHGCGLGYVDPLPSPEQLATLYNEDCRQGLTHTIGFERYVGAQRADHRALARRLGEIIEKAALGAQCPVPGPTQASASRRASRRASALTERGGAQRRLLDVGCAAGFLLDELRRRGWDVRGVELSADLCHYARSQLGLDVFCGELRDAPWPPASFEVVTVIGAIEHVPDPGDLVAAACRLLVPGGLLVILTENLENPIARRWPSAWNGFMPPEHLFHFTPATLGQLLARHGAAVTEVLPLRSQLRAALGGALPDGGTERRGDGAHEARSTKREATAALPLRAPCPVRRAPSGARLKHALKAALDGPPSARTALLRAPYVLADGIWRRIGAADRMIILGRTAS
jgi:2-polyprenyl-3-methyl-5-hydroxy-6-metoxy-1,4-benzoquinol methylase